MGNIVVSEDVPLDGIVQDRAGGLNSSSHLP